MRGGPLGREQAGFGGAARVQVLAHRPGCHEFPEAAGLGTGVTERIACPCRVEPEQACRRHRRAEGAAGGGIVPDPVVRRSYRGPDPAHGLETVQHGCEQLARARTELAAQRQCRRYYDAAGMGDRLAVQVVGFGDMRQGSHEQGAPALIERRAPGPVAQNGAYRRAAAGVGAGDRIEAKERRLVQVFVADRFVPDQVDQCFAQRHPAQRGAPWQRLNFLPELHGQGSLRPTRRPW